MVVEAGVVAASGATVIRESFFPKAWTWTR